MQDSNYEERSLTLCPPSLLPPAPAPDRAGSDQRFYSGPADLCKGQAGWGRREPERVGRGGLDQLVSQPWFWQVPAQSRHSLVNDHGITGHLSSCMWNLRFWGTMHRGVSAPSCCAFIHRVSFEEVTGHRDLINSGPGNRGLSACGTTHEATSRIPS